MTLPGPELASGGELGVEAVGGVVVGVEVLGVGAAGVGVGFGVLGAEVRGGCTLWLTLPLGLAAGWVLVDL
jgi:hypothetical protein